MTPKVSVVIPTFNRAGFLRAAISSVLDQTYQDFEIIVVDDASTDNTRKVVTAFNDERIRYIRHDKNTGEAGARNTGILNTDGEYIAFLDDDDEWLSEKLELQVRKFENSHAKTSLIYTGYFIFDDIEKKISGQRVPFSKGDAYHDLLKKNIIGVPSTVLLKKECIAKIGLFDSAVAYGLDYDYWIRVSRHYHFEFIAEPLVKYRIHENRLSNDIELKARGFRDLAKKYGRRIISKNRVFRDIFPELGITRCDKGDMKEGIKAFLWAVRFNPLNIRSYVYLGISIFGPGYFRRSRIMMKTLLTRLVLLISTLFQGDFHQ